VSYDRKHNESNLEHNRDGNNNNLSWNCGVEGPADDPAIKALRARQIRNFLATLLLSQGVPMLLAGDGTRPHPARQQQRLLPGQRSQLGGLESRSGTSVPCSSSSNAWCGCGTVTRFSGGAIFSRGGRSAGKDIKDIMWLSPDGNEMSDEEWAKSFARCLGVYLSGEALVERDQRGRVIVDDNFLLLFNAHHGEIRFTVRTITWLRLGSPARHPTSKTVRPLNGMCIPARSICCMEVGGDARVAQTQTMMRRNVKLSCRAAKGNRP